MFVLPDGNKLLFAVFHGNDKVKGMLSRFRFEDPWISKCWLVEMILVMTSLPLARVFQGLFTFALWLAELWQLSWQGATGELEVEFKFLTRSCKLSFLFLPATRAPRRACWQASPTDFPSGSIRSVQSARLLGLGVHIPGASCACSTKILLNSCKVFLEYSNPIGQVKEKLC